MTTISPTQAALTFKCVQLYRRSKKSFGERWQKYSGRSGDGMRYFYGVMATQRSEQR
jgi:hypothetical protein